MSGAKYALVSTIFITSLCLGTAHPVRAAQHPLRPQALKQPQAITEVTEQPAVALTPAQMPAAPPHVTFENGMLTIISKNSTLGDILRAVHNRTGAAVDVPPNATERVVANLGPGPARDVMAALLNGSHFNYVLLGSVTDANALDRVILTTKTASAPVESAAKNTPPPQPQADADDDDDSDTDADDSDDSGDTSSDSQNGGQAASDDEPQQVQPGVNGQPGLPNVRTPEQILQQLRQQQLQQQLGQQPGTSGQPNPGEPNGQPNPNQPYQQPPN